MLTSEVAKLNAFDRFCYWIKERQAIHLRKEAGRPAPWTDDQILRSNFFTNPYRENDKTTVWFSENIRDPLRDKPEVLFATICFRWFNYIPTGEFMKAAFRVSGDDGFGWFTDWRAKTVAKHLIERQDRGEKVFTGAFTISPSGSTKPKINRVCEDYIQPVWEARKDSYDEIMEGPRSLEHAWNVLGQYPGLAGGGFMAYEVITDLRFTHMLEDASDKETWANLGPGAIRGLNRILDRPVDGPKPKDWQEQCVQLLKRVQKKLSGMPKFEMREIEHSLCEVDKYERARLGQGHMKRKYTKGGPVRG